MGNIGAIMLLEDVTVKREHVSQPKNEFVDFAEILAVLLGQANFSVEQLLEDTLLAKEDVHCSLESEIEKNDIKGLLGMFNPEFRRELSNDEVELKNAILGEYLEKPAMESNEFYKKIERHKMERNLQQHVLNLKELAFLQETKDEKIGLEKKGLEELPEKASFITLKTENLTPEEKSVPEGKLIIESKLTNLSKREPVKDSEEIIITKQQNCSVESKEINTMPEKAVNLKKEVANKNVIESWMQFFSTEVSRNIEHGGEDLRLSTVHLARDLPEIVLAELKTFEHVNGNKDVIIHLEPKELGKLVVKLTSEEGVVSVKFVAHYSVTRNLLESGLDSLRQSFTEQGIPFSSLDVELGGQQLEQSQYQQQQLLWPEERRYQGISGDLENSYWENTLSETEPASLLKLGTYDYLV